jgi:hypothetical protein
MKAIINTKSATYKHLNGKTFNVFEIFTSFLALELPSNFVKGGIITTDFNHKEVIIVDIDNEIQSAFDDYNWGNDCKRYNNLRNYCITKKIKTNEELTYFA